MKKLQDLIDLALDDKTLDLDCSIVLKEEGQKIQAYSVIVSHRELLFFTEKGTLSYVIDSIGFNNYLCLIEWDHD